MSSNINFAASSRIFVVISRRRSGLLLSSARGHNYSLRRNKCWGESVAADVKERGQCSGGVRGEASGVLAVQCPKRKLNRGTATAAEVTQR